MADLKPCPFCGKHARLLLDVDDYDGSDYYAINCSNCRARTHYFSFQTEAIEAWNRRADNGT